MSHHGVQRGRVADKEEEEDEEETDGVVGVGEGLEQKMSSNSSRRAGPDSTPSETGLALSRAKHLAHLHGEIPVPVDQSSVDTDEEAFLDPVTLCLLERPVTLTCGHNVSKAVLKDMRRLGLRRYHHTTLTSHQAQTHTHTHHPHGPRRASSGRSYPGG